MYHAREIFKFFLRYLSHKQKTNEVLGHNFFETLDNNTKIIIDLVGIFQALEKTYDELYSLLNYISLGNLNWHGNIIKGLVMTLVGILEVDSITVLNHSLLFSTTK